jgi:hypothetical protein
MRLDGPAGRRRSLFGLRRIVQSEDRGLGDATDRVELMEFAATARIDTRLTVVDWPSVPEQELTDAVTAVTTFELANDAPAVLEDVATRHLAWRGYLTGGLLTLYERLGSLLSEHGLSAFYADPRLEVFVPAEGSVVVLGALRHPLILPRDIWDARVAKADSGDDLAAEFLRDALAGADSVFADAMRAAEEAPPSSVAQRPAAIETTVPGELDFELLDDSDYELTERYDPEGNLDETWVSCQVLRWRTDFVAPGTVLPPDQRLEDAVRWRVSQWEWTEEADPALAPDVAEDDELDSDGGWVLRANVPVTAADVAANLPLALQPWIRRVTQEVAEWMGDLAASDPTFGSAAEGLRAEAAALE